MKDLWKYEKIYIFYVYSIPFFSPFVKVFFTADKRRGELSSPRLILFYEIFAFNLLNIVDVLNGEI